MKLAYLSLTGNCRRFAKKTNLETFEITESNCMTLLDEPFILLVPSYEPEMVDAAEDFLQTNVSNCKGVIGSGNLNFGDDYYCYTAIRFANDYQVPNLFNFEYQGTDQDVAKLTQIIETLK